MAPPDAPARGSGGRILLALDVLMVDDPVLPRALSEASVALDRLEAVGEPVVLVGAEIAGRRLPADEAARATWVRVALGRPSLAVALFEESAAAERSDDAAARAEQDERWRSLARAWGADRLFTRRTTSVGPARRAGLEVIRIGPRDSAVPAAVGRPDFAARDLLDGVQRVLVDAVFEEAGRAAAP